MKTLIGVDFGESSVAAAGWVSRWFLPQAPLALAHSIWMPEAPSFLDTAEEEREVLLEQAKQEGKNALAPLVQEYGPRRTEALVGAGTPAETILALADEWGAELIVVGPHGHTRLLTGFFGSTASRLLHASRVPVLVVRDADAGRPERVLVAVDEGEAMSGVLEATRDVVDTHECDVTGFYAVERASDAVLPDAKVGGSVDPTVRAATESWLEQTLVGAGLPQTKVNTAVGVGAPGQAICTAAADNTQLIVMGTRGAGNGRSPLGSVARYVVAHAPCPVLVIPNDGD